MKIAIATHNFQRVASHAGHVEQWLVFDLLNLAPDAPLPPPIRIELSKAQALHSFNGDGPHPLDGASIMVAGGAGEGLIRRMKNRGADIKLTSERDPQRVVSSLRAGQPLPPQRFRISDTICKVHALFSRH